MKVVLATALVATVVFLSGCYGLSLSQMGMHYQTEKAKGLDTMKFTSIGVYALSDGKIKSIKESSIGMYMAGILPFYIVPFPYAGMLVTRTNCTDPYGFTPSHYPDKIEIPFKLRTDSANAGTSFEVALAMQKQLEERGYKAQAATDAPHKGMVTSEAILSHAAKSGHDAVFMIVYTLFNRWQRMAGSETISGFNSRTTIINVKYTEGYLVIPSAALVDVKTGRVLWSSAYYGLIANSQTPNVSNQALSIAVNDAIIEQGRDTYVDAAKIAVERIFNPKYWQGSYVPFPMPKQRKEGEKFDF
jgi:hypothetical protein